MFTHILLQSWLSFSHIKCFLTLKYIDVLPAGLVFEWTRDYAMSMEFAALMFLLSAVVQSLVPLIDRCSDKPSHNKLLLANPSIDVEPPPSVDVAGVWACRILVDLYTSICNNVL